MKVMDFKITASTKKVIRDSIFLDSEFEKPMDNKEYLFEVISRLSNKFPNDNELGQIVRRYVNQEIFNEQ
jgi:hypothetical protein